MNDEQMRKGFEEWMGDGGASPRAIERNSKGDYILMQAASAWEVWKAAHTHYAKPAAPVVLPEPVVALYTVASRFIDWVPCTVGFARKVDGGIFEVEYAYTEQQVRELLDNTKRSTNRDDESVGLREALVRAHDWMDSQADSQSKGGHETFDLMMLRAERNAIKSALDESPQPQADARDAIAAAVAAEREACAKLCETFADRVFDIGFTPVEKEHPFSTIAGANQCAVDIRARAAIAAAKEK